MAPGNIISKAPNFKWIANRVPLTGYLRLIISRFLLENDICKIVKKKLFLILSKIKFKFVFCKCLATIQKQFHQKDEIINDHRASIVHSFEGLWFSLSEMVKGNYLGESSSYISERIHIKKKKLHNISIISSHCYMLINVLKCGHVF